MLDRRLLVPLLAGLWIGVLAGCPNKKPKDPTCAGDKDCKDGQHCVNKKCAQCGEDSHCPKDQRCVKGGCVAAEPACMSDDECENGQVCKKGTCTACASNSECGPGGKCQAGVCDRPKACNKNEDCADDEDCVKGRCLQPWKSGAPSGVTCELKTVYFAFDQAALPAEARDLLNETAECIRKAPGERDLNIYGYADESGTEEYNIALSERRARTVADYLARLGIDPARFHIIPKGESGLTGRGSDADRRVEMQWR